jgi:16S rRNA (adenine1518-N6/adenine1519-N6)-dimethyltransferase
LLELAELDGSQTVLEIGAGTGSLTEELLDRSRRVVAVELDRRLADALRRRLAGRGNLTVLQGDALEGKKSLSAAVLTELAGAGDLHLVSNLPYHIAVPVLVNCLLESCRTIGAAPGAGQAPVRFQRLTATVQKELAERLTAGPGGPEYGPVSILVALLADVALGRPVPPQAFWPQPKVSSQMLRLDFAPARATELTDSRVLSSVLSAVFAQRRKKILSVARRQGLPFSGQRFLEALKQAGIDPSWRPQQVPPENYLRLANALCGPDR